MNLRDAWKRPRTDCAHKKLDEAAVIMPADKRIAPGDKTQYLEDLEATTKMLKTRRD